MEGVSHDFICSLSSWLVHDAALSINGVPCSRTLLGDILFLSLLLALFTLVWYLLIVPLVRMCRDIFVNENDLADHTLLRTPLEDGQLPELVFDDEDPIKPDLFDSMEGEEEEGEEGEGEHETPGLVVGEWERKISDDQRLIVYAASEDCVQQIDSPGAPTGRYGHSGVLCANGLFVVYGGFVGTTRSEETYHYSIDSRLWRKVATTGIRPGKRDCHSASLYHSEILVFGGGTGFDWRRDLIAYSPSLERWRDIPQFGHQPTGRAGHSTVVFNDKLLLFGGWNGETTLNDLYEFDLLRQTWRQIHDCSRVPIRPSPRLRVELPLDPISSSIPSRRDSHSCVMYNGRMLIVGGGHGHRRWSDMWSFDPVTEEWNCVSDFSGCGYLGRAGHIAMIHKNTLIVFGGGTGNQNATSEGEGWIQNLYCFDFLTRQWTVRDISRGSVIPGSYGLVGCVYRDRLVLFGGGDGIRFYRSVYEVLLQETTMQAVMWEEVWKRKKFVDCVIECVE